MDTFNSCNTIHLLEKANLHLIRPNLVGDTMAGHKNRRKKKPPTTECLLSGNLAYTSCCKCLHMSLRDLKREKTYNFRYGQIAIRKRNVFYPGQYSRLLIILSKNCLDASTKLCILSDNFDRSPIFFGST